MRVVDLTEDHLRRLEFREIERQDLGDNISQEDIDYFMASDFKKAVMDNEKVVIAVGGIMVGDACRTWVLGTDEMEKRPIASIKHIMDIEASFLLDHKPKFFFTYNLPDQPRVLRYLNRIGYREAGIDSDFTDGKTRLVMIKKVESWEP